MDFENGFQILISNQYTQIDAFMKVKLYFKVLVQMNTHTHKGSPNGHVL
jgi:hypothetical protein